MPDTIHKDLKILQKLSTTRKIIIVLFLVVLFVIGFTLGMLFTRPAVAPSVVQPQQTAIKPKPTVKPATELTLQPAFQVLSVGETLPVSVVIDKEPVQAVDVVLNYDPSVFKVTQLQKGEIFPLSLREKIEEGKITFSASVTPDNPEATGSGEVFKVLFTALSATPSSVIDFDRNETITALRGENTLGRASGGMYVVEE